MASLEVLVTGFDSSEEGPDCRLGAVELPARGVSSGGVGLERHVPGAAGGGLDSPEVRKLRA
jgi:hypothetical protein